MSRRPSFALTGSLILLFSACGGSSQTTLGDGGVGGTASASGGSNNLAGDTGAGGSSDGGTPGGGGSATGGQTGGSSGNQVCAPFDTGVCTGPGACVGGRECNADGMGWSPCDCGTGGGTGTGGAPSLGGTGGLTGNTGGATGGAATGGTSNTGGVIGVTGGASTGGASTGGTSTGGSATGGTAGTGGASVGSCESALIWSEWKNGTGADGDRVKFQCTANQLGCAGKQAGVDYLFQCNPTHVPTCQTLNPQVTGYPTWSFVSECPPPADCNSTLPYQYGWDADEVYATAVCSGSSACVGATNGLTYKFQCTDIYNCESQNPGTTNWATPPWKRVGLCQY